MKTRVLKWLALTFAALAVIDVVMLIPTLQRARLLGQFHAEIGDLTIIGHDAYVRGPFGSPWWLLPAVFICFAVALFAWGRKLRRPGRND